jgi:acyl carrier protein
MERTFEDVSKHIAKLLNVDLEEVIPSASFIDDLGADSLDLVELLMSLEQQFDIGVSDADAEKMATIQDVLNYLDIE